ncbi:hypothetical protein DL96DRAFT_1643866 [Flagelloscypha sp. PMI_526]|nr:hypothetical protein DL96DRAFT_1643866 [Flagelloscypha sp. PMI_526]
MRISLPFPCITCFIRSATSRAVQCVKGDRRFRIERGSLMTRSASIAFFALSAQLQTPLPSLCSPLSPEISRDTLTTPTSLTCAHIETNHMWHLGYSLGS